LQVICTENPDFLSQGPAESLVQQGLFQLGQGGELLLVDTGGKKTPVFN
jgi:hypothetical protein